MASNSREDGGRRAHFEFVWAIESASEFSLSKKLLSTSFVVESMERTKWHLEAKADHSTNRFMLFICRELDAVLEMFEIDFELAFHDSEGSLLAAQRGTSQFRKDGSRKCKVIFDEEVLFKNLPLDNLVITCRMWRTGCDVSQFGSCIARTYLRVDQQSIVWAIKQFSFLRPGQSRTVNLYSNFKSLPTLTLSFDLQEKDGKVYSYITGLRNQVVKNYSMDIRVCLLDVKGLSVKSIKKDLMAWKTLKREKVCESSQFFEREQIMTNRAKFLRNDVLSLRCDFEIITGPLWSGVENYRPLESSDVGEFAPERSSVILDVTATACCSFKNVLESLYKDDTLSDISLTAGALSFSAHKNILSARSPVFNAMFTKDMRENTEKCVDIPDLSAETLRRLLLYIYTNRVEKLRWEDAFQLFIAAGKYELLELREMCSDFLKDNLSSVNACDILVLADLHHDEGLRKEAQDFIQEMDIFASRAWKNFKEEHPKLALETTERIICNMRNLRF